MNAGASGGVRTEAGAATLAGMIETMNWPGIGQELSARGCATTGVLLSPAACASLVDHYDDEGTRGVYRVTMRHRVSRIRRGQRHTLGIMFHDAR